MDLHLLSKNANMTNEDGVVIRKVHVKGFRPTISKAELENLFVRFGEIQDSSLVHSPEGVPIFAFITFVDCRAAKKALMSNVYHHKKKMIVSPADTWHQPRQENYRKNNSGKATDKSQSTHKGNDKKEEQVASSSKESVKDIGDHPPIENGITILDMLNHDCLMKILSYLSMRELLYSERVSKKWQAIVNEKLRETRVFKSSMWAREKTPLTTNTLRCLFIKFGDSLRKLHLDYEWTMLNQRTPQIIAKFCPSLTDLLITRTAAKSWGLALAKCTNLRSLKLYSCDDISDHHFKDINSNLEELSIVNNSSLSGQFLQYIDTEHLKKLDLSKGFSIENRHLLKYFAEFKNLRKLALDYCSSVTTIMDQFIKLVPHLTEFSFCNIGHSHKLGNINAIAELKDLEVLLLANNCAVSDELLQALSKSCLKLTTIDISTKKTSFFKEYFLTHKGINHLWKLPELEVLAIGGQNLKDNAFDKLGTYPFVSKLKTLVCRHISGISNDGLIKVVQMCPDIRKIDAYCCHNVNEEFVISAGNAVMCHPNRTETLVLNIVHYGMHTQRSKDAINQLNCPLIRVEVKEEFCDPLLHSYKVSYEGLSDSDDNDEDFDYSDDDYYDDVDFADFMNQVEFDPDDLNEEDFLHEDYILQDLNRDEINLVRAFFFQALP